MRGESHIEKFVSELQLKNYSNQTIKNYKSVVTKFMDTFGLPPKLISQEDIKDYLRESSSVSDLKNKISALKFFYKKVIHQPLKFKYIEYPRKERKLPRVIDQQTLTTKIKSIPNIKHKAILSLAYCCGLRVSEVVNLKISDIDGRQRIILISQSKGKKDRYVNGVDLRVIQTVAGHRSPNTTAIYTHVSPKFLSSISTPI